jgi:hypothetical protein
MKVKYLLFILASNIFKTAILSIFYPYRLIFQNSTDIGFQPVKGRNKKDRAEQINRTRRLRKIVFEKFPTPYPNG